MVIVVSSLLVTVSECSASIFPFPVVTQEGGHYLGRIIPLFSQHSSCSQGAHHTHTLHWCLHHYSPQPHLHHHHEHRGRHSNDSDSLLARTFWKYLTLWQSSQCLQCNKSWADIQVHHSLQFWHAIIWLWFLLLYSQHPLCLIIVIHCGKWFSSSFNKLLCG